MSTLKQKAEIVIEENSRLHEQIIDGIQNEFSDLNGCYIASEVAIYYVFIVNVILLAAGLHLNSGIKNYSRVVNNLILKLINWK